MPDSRTQERCSKNLFGGNARQFGMIFALVAIVFFQI